MSTLAAGDHRSLLRPLRLIASDIKLAHSIFALPFALLGAFMAAAADPSNPLVAHWARLAGQLALIVVAMILARTVAMLSNRLLDREIDVRNPRTAGRALPSGRLSIGAAAGAMVVCAAGFLLTCAAFGWFHQNWWPAILGAPVLAWISIYPLLKRWTALCHLWLGASLALSPLAAAIAIEPESVNPFSPAWQPAVWLLSAMVLCWVAGFDIIYALQDVEIDRAQKLHSMPSRLGVPGAMWVSRALHAAATACLVAAGLIDPRFGVLFGAGIIVIALLLIYEHLTVARWGASRMALAFFTLNGVISCVLGALGILDVLV